MYNFDLKKVHDLLSFNSLCENNDDYMTEASSLRQIELDTEALYVLKPKMSVLFTTKLRYYRLLIQKEINYHINEATNLLEADGSDEMAKYVLKMTKEAVTTLVSDAVFYLKRDDFAKLNWKNITATPPLVIDDYRHIIERVVFYHYVIAELTRCWLELQDRYAYVIGEAGCYDVSLFYTTFVEAFPDPEFELIRSEKYNEESQKFRKIRTDCCFLYDNKEYFAHAIQEFTNKLKQYKFIPEDVDCKQMESLFSGHSCRRTYTWLGPNHILTHIIKGLINVDNPIITTWPSGASPWLIVSERFVDKEGIPLPNIRTESERKNMKSVVTDVIETLATYLD